MSSSYNKNIQVFVKENERTKLYRIDENSSIQTFTEIISTRSNIPQDNFFLIYAGRVLDNSKSLDFYGICESSSITLSIRNFNSFPNGNLLERSAENVSNLKKPPPMKRQLTGHKWEYGSRISQEYGCPSMVQIDYRKEGKYYYVMIPNEIPCEGFYDDLVNQLSKYGYTWEDIKQFDHDLLA